MGIRALFIIICTARTHAQMVDVCYSTMVNVIVCFSMFFTEINV